MAKQDFFETEDGADIERVLLQMATDEGYHTKSSYSANGELYPDNKISFVEKHKRYLRTHPSTNPQHYIANLRLMTRKNIKVK
ncbi:hypothetical protein KY385_00320 [Candidatus Parcubacteria bacterium]|nr:hypothetical protein [Candidatus Parcubacteria bacterium]